LSNFGAGDLAYPSRARVPHVRKRPMMIENKPGVVQPMRKALKELGIASCRVIARQLARNVDLAKVLILRNVEGGVDPGGNCGKRCSSWERRRRYCLIHLSEKLHAK